MRYERNRKIRDRRTAPAPVLTLFLALTLFLTAGTGSVRAADSMPGDELQAILNPRAESVPETPADSHEPGEFLVIADEKQDAYTADTLGTLGYELTAMGYRADYTTSRIYSGKTRSFDETYDRIIWVTSSRQTSEKDLLRCPDTAYGGSLLMLGAMPEELTKRNNLGQGFVSTEEVSGTASYQMKGQNVFTSLVSLDVSRLYRTADYMSGTWKTTSGTYPLTVGWGTLRNLVLRDYRSDFAKAVLMEEITLWLWPYHNAPHSDSSCLVLDELKRYKNGGTTSDSSCLVLDEIYPYTDPERLLRLVKELESRNMNYVLSVMPLYRHSDYPGMKQFCEVLRYAQAHGGTVILHSPIIQNGVETNELQESLTSAFESYIENDVYPIALSIPSAWIFDDDLHETLGRYRTLFLEDTAAFSEKSGDTLASACNRFLSLGTQLFTPAIPLDDTGVSYLDTCATAVYVNAEEDDEKIGRIIGAARYSPVSMESLWDMDQAVYTNRSHYLTWDGKNLICDGGTVSLAYHPKPYDENFNYKRNVYYRATADLARENVLLIFFSLAVSILFVVLILAARRQMERQFLFRRRSDRPPDAADPGGYHPEGPRTGGKDRKENAGSEENDDRNDSR